MTAIPLNQCYNATEMFASLNEMLADPARASEREQIQYWLAHREDIERLSVFYGLRRRPRIGNRRFIKVLQDYILSNIVSGGLMDHDEVLPSHLSEDDTKAFAWLADQLDPPA